MNRLIQKFNRLLIEPRSVDDENRRREFIVNVLLAGSCLLSAAAFVSTAANSILLGRNYHGLNPVAAGVIVALFLGLWLVSRSGGYLVPAYTLVGLLLILALYALMTWGITLPEPLLVLAVAIVMASVLLGTRAGSLTMFVIAVGLVTLAVAQESGQLKFDDSWMTQHGSISDAVAFAVTLGIITLVSWLSNREIERSLERAKRSENELKRERDSLEIKVAERTRELERVQREKIMALTRFAEFGRLTSGIIHELVTPLTTVTLNLEQMKDTEHSEKLHRAIDSTKRMERYIESARKQLQNQTEITDFAMSAEIEAALEFLAPQAKKHQVKLDFIKLDDPELTGNEIKFYQLVTNLVANGIGAYSTGEPKHNARVTVELVAVGNVAQVRVQDWGSGISERYMDKIFDPFFTLKAVDQGMGIGLSLVKEIVENEFGGTIEVNSTEGSGTTFTVRLPLKHQPRDDAAH